MRSPLVRTPNPLRRATSQNPPDSRIRRHFDSTCWLGGGQQECRSHIRELPPVSLDSYLSERRPG